MFGAASACVANDGGGEQGDSHFDQDVSAGTITSQVKLFQSTNRITVHVDRIVGDCEHTLAAVGLEDPNGDHGLELYYGSVVASAAPIAGAFAPPRCPPGSVGDPFDACVPCEEGAWSSMRIHVPFCCSLVCFFSL